MENYTTRGELGEDGSTCDAVHLFNGEGKEAREGTGHGCSGEEDR
jgi:hypothetical protein